MFWGSFPHFPTILSKPWSPTAYQHDVVIYILDVLVDKSPEQGFLSSHSIFTSSVLRNPRVSLFSHYNVRNKMDCLCTLQMDKEKYKLNYLMQGFPFTSVVTWTSWWTWGWNQVKDLGTHSRTWWGPTRGLGPTYLRTQSHLIGTTRSWSMGFWRLFTGSGDWLPILSAGSFYCIRDPLSVTYIL